MNRRTALFSACLPGWGVQQVIAAARLLGFGEIEWGVGASEAIPDRGAAADAQRLCRDAGLRCGGIAVQDKHVTLATPDLAAPFVELGSMLAAPHIRVRAPAYDGDQPLQRQQDAARRGLDALVAASSPHRLAVLVETSPDTLAPSPETALDLIARHAPARVGVLYDPGNMIIEGHVEPRLAIARLDRYLAHVHVKNVAWHQRDDTWHWDYSALGTGLADWSVIIPALAAAGYQGRFSIDHLPGRATEMLLATEAEALSALIDQAFPATAAASVTEGASSSGAMP
ncbi:MAG: sugar phosphate isomerase/epimerase family protein [Solirubrobacteraceae bacterium]